MVDQGKAGLKAISEPVFDLGIEIRSVIRPAFLTGPKSDELVDFVFAVRKGLRASDESKELFVSVKSWTDKGKADKEENECGEGWSSAT